MKQDRETHKYDTCKNWCSGSSQLTSNQLLFMYMISPRYAQAKNASVRNSSMFWNLFNRFSTSGLKTTTCWQPCRLYYPLSVLGPDRHASMDSWGGEWLSFALGVLATLTGLSYAHELFTIPSTFCRWKSVSNECQVLLSGWSIKLVRLCEWFSSVQLLGFLPEEDIEAWIHSNTAPLLRFHGAFEYFWVNEADLFELFKEPVVLHAMNTTMTSWPLFLPVL